MRETGPEGQSLIHNQTVRYCPLVGRIIQCSEGSAWNNLIYHVKYTDTRIITSHSGDGGQASSAAAADSM